MLVSIKNKLYVIPLVFLFACKMDNNTNGNGIPENSTLDSKTSNSEPPDEDSLKLQQWTEEMKQLRQKLLLFYNEQEIKNSPNETYRFFWSHPFTKGETASLIIRIELFDTGSADLVVKFVKKGKTTMEEKRLSGQQIAAFHSKVKAASFWSLNNYSLESSAGTPSVWYLEGVRKSEYHAFRENEYTFVQRYSPPAGCFRDLCESLIQLAANESLSWEVKQIP